MYGVLCTHSNIRMYISRHDIAISYTLRYNNNKQQNEHSTLRRVRTNAINTTVDSVYIFSHYQCDSVGKNKWIINDLWGKACVLLVFQWWLVLPVRSVVGRFVCCCLFQNENFSRQAVCGMQRQRLRQEDRCTYGSGRRGRLDKEIQCSMLGYCFHYLPTCIPWHFYLLFIIPFLLIINSRLVGIHKNAPIHRCSTHFQILSHVLRRQ